MKILKLSTALLFFICFTAIQAQEITGVWKTIDDKSGEPKSHIKIYEKDGLYYGRVIELLPAATTSTCDGCPDGKEGKSLLEVDIVGDMKPYKDYFSYGYIIDPAGGKKYKCSIWRDGDKLNVRGYIGISALGRTQTWHMVEEK